MHTTEDRTRQIHEAYSAPSLRLALRPEGAPKGLLDGAWWPHSRDLLRELPSLTDVLDPLRGRITRISVNPVHWPVVPRAVPVAGRAVKVGWFRDEQDPHKLVLLSHRIGRWDLLVIPPQTDAAAAARLMAGVTGGEPRLTASALVAAEAARMRNVEQLGREEEWESEGGTALVALAAPGGVPESRPQDA